MNKIAVLVAAATLSGACLAQSNKWAADQQDLENCRWRPTGEALGQELCDKFRAEVARDKEIAEQQKLRLELQRMAAEQAQMEKERALRKEIEEFELRQAKKGAEEEAQFQKALAERMKLLAGKKKDPYSSCFEQWKVNGVYKEMPCDPNKKSPSQVEYEKEQAAMKKKCGKDYQQLRVGMSLQRFEDCTDGVVFVTDTMTAGGLVETYRSSFYIINVKNDRVVSYTRRRY
jgi:hypothetical protein